MDLTLVLEALFKLDLAFKISLKSLSSLFSLSPLSMPCSFSLFVSLSALTRTFSRLLIQSSNVSWLCRTTWSSSQTLSSANETPLVDLSSVVLTADFTFLSFFVFFFFRSDPLSELSLSSADSSLFFFFLFSFFRFSFVSVSFVFSIRVSFLECSIFSDFLSRSSSFLLNCKND